MSNMKPVKCYATLDLFGKYTGSFAMTRTPGHEDFPVVILPAETYQMMVEALKFYREYPNAKAALEAAGEEV
jgi:hypothetical protein